LFMVYFLPLRSGRQFYARQPVSPRNRSDRVKAQLGSHRRDGRKVPVVLQQDQIVLDRNAGDQAVVAAAGRLAGATAALIQPRCSPPRPRCPPGPSARGARPLIVVALAHPAGAVKIEKFPLPSALHETPERNGNRFPHGPDVGKPHGFLDELVVEHDIGSHNTPLDVYKTSDYHRRTPGSSAVERDAAAAETSRAAANGKRMTVRESRGRIPCRARPSALPALYAGTSRA